MFARRSVGNPSCLYRLTPSSLFCVGEGNRPKDLLSAFQFVPGDTGAVGDTGETGVGCRLPASRFQILNSGF